MVLADTSVWIRALAGQQPFRHSLDDILKTDQVAGHDLVYGELLIGDKGGRKQTLAVYRQIRYATNIPHTEVARFVEERRLYGRGIGWIDAHLLASAVADHIRIWTADGYLAELAEEFGVAFSPKKR